MAIVIGTNAGFVTVAPTADPGNTASRVIDDRSTGFKDTSPSGSNRVTEVGVWLELDGDNNVGCEIGLYSDAGAGEPEARLFVETGLNTGSAGNNRWLKFTGLDWELSASTVYWLAIQVDASVTDTAVGNETSGGSGFASLNSQSALPADWGSSAATDADGLIAIYALVEEVEEEASATGGATARKYGGAVADGVDRLDRKDSDMVRKYA